MVILKNHFAFNVNLKVKQIGGMAYQLDKMGLTRLVLTQYVPILYQLFSNLRQNTSLLTPQPLSSSQLEIFYSRILIHFFVTFKSAPYWTKLAKRHCLPDQ